MALSEITKITGPGIHTLSNVLSHNIKSSGIITATKFSGPLDSIGGNFAGVITATSANFSGNVTIGGTLTYEDVTNIDSVGIITANQGIHVGAGVSAVGVGTFGSLDIGGDLDVDGHTNLDNVSIAGVTTCSDQINMLDDKIIRLGTAAASRTSIYYDSSGTNTWIKNFNDTLKIGHKAVEMYYMNQKRLEFINGGTRFSTDVNITFLGANYHAGWQPANNRFQINDNAKLAFGSQADTTIHHNNSNLLISNTTGNIDVTGNVVLNNDISVDGHTNLDNVSIAGVITATSFVGSGANLTSLPAQATIANNADNRVITGGSGVNLNGEANLTYNGSILHNQISAGARNDFSTSADGLIIEKGGNTGLSIDPGSSGVANIYFPNESNHSIASISHNNSTGEFRIRGEDHVLISTNNNNERLRIDSSGRLLIGTATATGAAKLQLLQSSGDGLLVRNHDTNYEGIILSNASGEARVMATSGGSTARPALTFFAGDAERVRIDINGKLLKGHTADVGQIRTQFNQDNQFVGSNNAGIRIASYSNNAYASSLEFVKSRSDTKGTNTLVQNSDVLGQIFWGAADGTNYQPAAYIIASMDGATNTNDIPTKLVFGTASDGANGATERLRIQSNGYMGLNTSGAQRLFSVKETNNKASLLIWRTSETNGDYSGIDFSGHPSNNGSNYQKGGIYWQTDGSGFGRGDMVFCNDGAANADNVVIGDEKMRIHKEGYVTKPSQPAFRAHDSNHAQNGFLTFDQITTNVGSHYNGSNGRFTVPVAGTYFFTFYGMLSSSSQNGRVEYYINGSVHSSGEHYGGVAYTNGATYNMISCSTVLTLSVNDYVNLNWNTGYNSMHSYHNGFMGYLIG